MSRLSLQFLGPFGAALDDKPIVGFESNKVRALIAYLAVESDYPHRRESLAGLLWPEMPDRLALSNLRYALSNLRGSIGDREAQPPFLIVTRDSIQFNTRSDHTLDTAAFLDAAAAHDISPEEPARLAAALSLYRGAFLEGFSVGGSPAFEEWALIRREQIGRQAVSAFRALADEAEHRREYVLACTYARRQIELEPWDEEGHRQLMRCLAPTGQRNAALHQYTVCRRLLAKELGVEPADETTALYRSVRTATLSATASPSPHLRSCRRHVKLHLLTGQRRPARPHRPRLFPPSPRQSYRHPTFPWSPSLTRWECESRLPRRSCGQSLPRLPRCFSGSRCGRFRRDRPDLRRRTTKRPR